MTSSIAGASSASMRQRRPASRASNNRNGPASAIARTLAIATCLLATAVSAQQRSSSSSAAAGAQASSSASAGGKATLTSVTDPVALKAAAQQALTNLMGYYNPSAGGVFNQVQTPWHESGIIWNTYWDYAKWTGDNMFSSVVAGALVNASYGTQQDFLGGALKTQEETLNGKWNDDILWPAQAILGGAEIYGASAMMPAAKGPWITAPQKTLDQTWEDQDSKCGGGIYWSRDRGGSSPYYKSFITEAEFIQTAARINLLTKNATVLDLATQIYQWIQSASLLTADGTVSDGVQTTACNVIISDQWSYNYGELIGACAWMHLATGDQSWLDMASTVLTKALSLFFTGDSITEICETSGKACNRDQQGFKAVFVRNLAYLYRETTDQGVKSAIAKAIDSSVTSMVARSCDSNWNCNGNWTAGSTPIKYVRSQHVSSALLVAALGIHSTAGGTGLLTQGNTAALNVTGSGSTTGGTNQGSVTSTPLGAASLLSASHLPLLIGGIVAVASAVLGTAVLV